jgi:hypothetical protein
VRSEVIVEVSITSLDVTPCRRFEGAQCVYICKEKQFMNCDTYKFWPPYWYRLLSSGIWRRTIYLYTLRHMQEVWNLLANDGLRTPKGRIIHTNYADRTRLLWFTLNVIQIVANPHYKNSSAALIIPNLRLRVTCSLRYLRVPVQRLVFTFTPGCGR